MSLSTIKDRWDSTKVNCTRNVRSRFNQGLIDNSIMIFALSRGINGGEIRCIRNTNSQIIPKSFVIFNIFKKIALDIIFHVIFRLMINLSDPMKFLIDTFIHSHIHRCSKMKIARNVNRLTGI